MIRGTTPIHTFTLPFDVSVIKTVKVIYAQDDIQLFCKRTEDCELDGSVIRVGLTQEETFLFDCKKQVQIQIRVLTLNGDSISTDVINVSVKKCLDYEVLE